MSKNEKRGYNEAELTQREGLVERLRVSVNELMQIARQDYTQEDPTTGDAYYSEGQAIVAAAAHAHEAADALERMAQEHAEDAHSNLKLQDTIAALRAENERRIEELEASRGLTDYYSKECYRLRAALEKIARREANNYEQLSHIARDALTGEGRNER